MVERAKEGIKRKANGSEIYGEMQAVFVEIDKSPVVSVYVDKSLNLSLYCLERVDC